MYYAQTYNVIPDRVLQQAFDMKICALMTVE